mmetsp:Transcript_39205/g.79935  ORF Transcript_39205/g.79935 Transcript_39205/m.79935 type:complete len:138 (-) Transcript_39205:398-811(-)
MQDSHVSPSSQIPLLLQKDDGAAVVGAELGNLEGTSDGAKLGNSEGTSVGAAVVGAELGNSEGTSVGAKLGNSEATSVGTKLGNAEETADGLGLGNSGSVRVVKSVLITSSGMPLLGDSQAMARLSPPPPSLKMASR